MEGAAWQVGRVMAVPHSKHSQQLLCSSSRTHYPMPCCVVLLPCGAARWGCRLWPREGAMDDGVCAGGQIYAWCSHVGFFPLALLAKHCLGLQLRPGFSPFCCPAALLPPNLPGSEPGNCSHCLQAGWDGGPKTPPSLTSVYWGSGFVVYFHHKPQQCE